MVRVVLLVLVAFAVLLIIMRRRAPKMRFSQGRLVRAHGWIDGRVREAFVDIAQRGEITGIVEWVGTNRLRFSISIGEADRQRFRNALGAR